VDDWVTLRIMGFTLLQCQKQRDLPVHTRSIGITEMSGTLKPSLRGAGVILSLMI